MPDPDPSRLNSDENLLALGFEDATTDHEYAYCMTDRQWLDVTTFQATAAPTTVDEVDAEDECLKKVKTIVAGKAQLKREIHIFKATVRRVIDYYLEAITDPSKQAFWSGMDKGLLGTGVPGLAPGIPWKYTVKAGVPALVLGGYKIYLSAAEPLYDRSYAVLRDRVYTAISQEELDVINHESEIPVSRVTEEVINICNDDQVLSSVEAITGPYDEWDRSILESLGLTAVRGEFVQWLEGADLPKLRPKPQR